MEEKEVMKVVQGAVQETLVSLGFNPDNPSEMQANMVYLSKLRRGSEFMSMRIKASLVAFTIPTLLYLLWESFKKIISDV